MDANLVSGVERTVSESVNYPFADGPRERLSIA
jgi:hypothetical protein